jgi:hypothetical protein
MSRRKTSSVLEDYIVGTGVVGIVVLCLSVFPAYWFLSGFCLNYTMRFWLGTINNGEPVEIPAWPGYVGGGFLGGTPIIAGGITYVIDSANVVPTDPNP